MKKLTIGIIIGLMLGMSTNAFAAIGDSVTAVFAQFSYMVNGESKNVDAPVLVYEGSSYVRTTDIGNMLGYDVTYKSDSRTIEFNKPEPTVTDTVYEEPTATGTPIEDEPEEPTTEPTTEPSPTEPITEPTEDPTVEEPIDTTEPTAEPEPTVEPEPVVEEPAPDNTAVCQGIRDSWTLKIYSYQGKNPKEQEYTRKLMGQQRDAALAAEGCS